MGEDRLDHFGQVKISEIMIPDPQFTTPNEKISATELLMLRKKINGLPVVNNNKNRKVVGIITQRDIRLARFAVSLDSKYTTVKDLMTTNPIIIKEDNSIKDALIKFFKFDIERLPVVDENGELVGLVVEQKILRKLLDYLNM
jgi:IMP dehydrogenase